MSHPPLLACLAVACALIVCSAWKLPQTNSLKIALRGHSGRLVFAAGLALLLPGGELASAPTFGLIAPAVVHADGGEGSKTDKKFELCVSKCIFSETRPPPAGSTTERLEARERGGIIKECRKTCAKNKEQLMTGTPKKVKTPQQAAPPAPQQSAQ